MGAFISYASKDKVFAQKLVNKLAENGIQVWFAEQEINLGSSLAERIVSQVEISDTVLVLLSQNSLGSDWMMTEIALAVSARNAGRSKKIIPILADKNAEIPFLLRDLVYLDLSDESNFEKNFKSLVRTLTNPKLEEWNPAANQEANLKLIEAKLEALDKESIALHEINQYRSTKIQMLTISALSVGVAGLFGIALSLFADVITVRMSSAIATLSLGFLTGVLTPIITQFFCYFIASRSLSRKHDSGDET